MNKSSALHNVFNFLKPYKIRIFAGLLALLTVVVCMLLIGFAIKHFIDNGFSQNNNQEALGHIVILIFIFGIASFFRSYIINTTAEFVANDVKKAAYNSLIHFSSNEIDEFAVADIAGRINSDSDYISRVVIDSTSFFLRNILTTIGGISLMFHNSAKLSSITFIVIALISIVATTISKKVRALAKEAENAKSKISNLILETIINNKVLIAFSKQKTLKNHYEKLNEDTKSKIIARLKFRSIFFAIVITSMLLTISLIVWLGSKEVTSGTLSHGTLASFLFYSFMTATSFGGIMEMMNDQQKNLAHCERVFDIINLTAQTQTTTQKIINLPKNGLIQLKNIDYNHHKNSLNTLSSLNINFEIGKFNVVTGASGIGKTTLLNLIMGIYNFKNGSIIIGGEIYNSISPDMWDKKLAYVPQDSMLFSGTILENTSFFEQDVKLEKLEYFIKNLLLEPFIKNLSNGVNSDLGSLANKISGGQKQRIAICRALLLEPDILILDEATSQLDEETESAVLDFIKKIMKNKTIICVAHRRGAISKADIVINLSN